MKVEILEEARGDLVDGFRFYEKQEEGLGTYFLDSLLASTGWPGGRGELRRRKRKALEDHPGRVVLAPTAASPLPTRHGPARLPGGDHAG